MKENCNCDDFGDNLEVAAEDGNLNLVKKLVKSQTYQICQCDPRDIFDRTPLHLAAMNGHFSVVRFLMKNLNNTDPRDRLGQTPIYRYELFYLY